METIIIDEKEYYEADEIRKISPIYFKGCRNAREIIKNKVIGDDSYMFGICKDDKWTTTDGLSKKLDKLLLSVEWVKNNVPELSDNKEVKHAIEKAPAIIILTEDEKMKDNEGNIMEIEVRGERKSKGCFFLVKDVMVAFDMKNLNTTIIDKKSNYSEKEDYVYFNCNIIGKNPNNSIKKELYLTYSGLLRVLFASHSKSAKKFVDWATETLFTAHLGTTKQKQRLASNLLGVDPMAVREVFNKTSTTMPCIYLFNLGSVKDLREKMNIDAKYADNMCVYKWGMTNDLFVRTDQHITTFLALNIEIKLARYNYVDPQYMAAAETDLKKMIKGYGFHFTFNTMSELAILNKKNLSEVEREYDRISKSYMGHVHELVSKNKDLENALKNKDFENTIKLAEVKHSLEMEIQKMQMDNKMKEQELLNKLKEQEQKLLNKMKEQELLNKINILELTKKNEINNNQKIDDKKIVVKDGLTKKTAKHIEIDEEIVEEIEEIEEIEDERTNDQKIYDEFIEKHLIKKIGGRERTVDISNHFLQWRTKNDKKMRTKTDQSMKHGLNARIKLSFVHKPSMRIDSCATSTSCFVDIKYVK